MFYTWFRDRDSGLRVLPECTNKTFDVVKGVRWPAALEPWLTGSVQRQALPPWVPACRYAAAPEAGLYITGVGQGTILHRAGGFSAPVVKLEVRGHQGEVMWLINGRLAARQSALQGLKYVFSTPGRYDITVMDDHGRYDRVSVSVR